MLSRRNEVQWAKFVLFRRHWCSMRVPSKSRRMISLLKLLMVLPSVEHDIHRQRCIPSIRWSVRCAWPSSLLHYICEQFYVAYFPPIILSNFMKDVKLAQSSACRTLKHAFDWTLYYRDPRIWEAWNSPAHPWDQHISAMIASFLVKSNDRWMEFALFHR